MLKDNAIGKNKYSLDTPVLVIDKNKLINNLTRMQNFAKSKNIDVRPHAKTHKCSTLCKLQLDSGAVGVCVTKVSEAYALAKTGITGILITSPIITLAKINVLLEVLKLSPDTMLIVDNFDNALMLNDCMSKHGIKLTVLLDVDGGIGRTGCGFEDAVILAKQINNLSNLCFKGIQCYAGHIQHIKSISERSVASRLILEKAGMIKKQLNQDGINCKIQTGSGTGTFSIDATIETVTEIQPGSYAVMDQEYSDIEFDSDKYLPAMTMLTTVISANHTTHVTVDAGTKALYKVDTNPKVISHKNLYYDWDGFGDEHGKVTALVGTKLPKLGEVLELVVAHCDPTINLFDKFYITENDVVIEVWDIDLRGKCQ